MFSWSEFVRGMTWYLGSGITSLGSRSHAMWLRSGTSESGLGSTVSQYFRIWYQKIILGSWIKILKFWGQGSNHWNVRIRDQRLMLNLGSQYDSPYHLTLTLIQFSNNSIQKLSIWPGSIDLFIQGHSTGHPTPYQFTWPKLGKPYSFSLYKFWKILFYCTSLKHFSKKIMIIKNDLLPCLQPEKRYTFTLLSLFN